MTDEDKSNDDAKSATIKTQLRKAFDEKASEDLPDELLSLIGKLREQDETDAK